MGIIIATQEEINDYFETESVNQSKLKPLIGGLDGYMAEIAKKRKEKEENKPLPDYFLIGAAVDCILTGEEGEFEKQYYVSTLDKTPSEVEIQIIESVFNEMVDNDVIQDVEFEDCGIAILAAADEFNWQGRWKAETRVEKIKLVGTTYFNELKNSIGLQIISKEMKNKIDSIVMSLTTNHRTKKYFNRELQMEMENMDFYYQLPIYFTIEGVECKALMDLVVVHKDSNGNIIKIEPIDLKTMSGNTLQFVSNVKKHRYDIQAAWYVKALSEYFKCDESVIEDFKFIVESTTNVGTPLVFKITKDMLAHGKFGSPQGSFIDPNTGRELFYPEVKGYSQLLKDYNYYYERDFKEDKIIETNDIITIDWVKGIVS